ncbi:MAG: hypothetical protein IPL32_17235 [Chloracidobacterium sp.]|nr:hypothetical protein [Chloracidobacterium sp.]
MQYQRDLPISIQQFIGSEQWTFAKTMPEWPHEYLVRNRVDENLFMRFARHIWDHGYQGRFYDMRLTYYAYDGRVYWTMGEPDDKTMILNRCMKDDTYESRKRNGTLPVRGPVLSK